MSVTVVLKVTVMVVVMVTVMVVVTVTVKVTVVLTVTVTVAGEMLVEVVGAGQPSWRRGSPPADRPWVAVVAAPSRAGSWAARRRWA